MKKRKLPSLEVGNLTISDDWTPPRSDPWFTSAMQVMLAGDRQSEMSEICEPDSGVKFAVNVPYVTKDQQVFVVGETEELGKWDLNNAPQLLYVGDRIFCSEEIQLSKLYAEYKFVLKGAGGETVWEGEKNRTSAQKKEIVNAFFRYPRHTEPRVAGINVPVFSLNTRSNFGCGEFSDLKKLADFCVKAGLKVIQVLPVFDTINKGTWVDSYPYGAITVFALHPMYINLDSIPNIT